MHASDMYSDRVDECNVLTVYSQPTPPPSVWPHLFCGAGQEKRRGEQLKLSLAFRLYIGSFPSAQLPDVLIQPGWAECFCVFSLGLCFVLFDLFVCPHSFVS